MISRSVALSLPLSASRPCQEVALDKLLRWWTHVHREGRTVGRSPNGLGTGSTKWIVSGVVGALAWLSSPADSTLTLQTKPHPPPAPQCARSGVSRTGLRPSVRLSVRPSKSLSEHGLDCRDECPGSKKPLHKVKSRETMAPRFLREVSRTAGCCTVFKPFRIFNY